MSELQVPQEPQVATLRQLSGQMAALRGKELPIRQALRGCQAVPGHQWGVF